MMHNPPHPGEIIKNVYMKTLGLTITETAKSLGITRQSLSKIINGKTSVSIEMSLRLSIAFRTSMRFWLNLQMEHDLWITRNKKIGGLKFLVNSSPNK